MERGQISHRLEEPESNWYKNETKRMTSVERLLWRIGYRLRREMCLFADAPNIEGISPGLQERDRLKLIRLRLRDRLGKEGHTLSFTERKRLKLSDKTDFYRNFGFRKPPSFEIDKPVHPLVQALNAKPYLYSGECCSGHLKSNPENQDDCMFYDTGYITIYTDEYDERVNRLVKGILPRFCREESEANSDCSYDFEDNGDSTYTLTWKWNNPDFQELLGQLYRPEMQNTPEEKKTMRKLWALSPLARESNIPQKHEEFIKKVADLIRSYE